MAEDKKPEWADREYMGGLKPEPSDLNMYPTAPVVGLGSRPPSPIVNMTPEVIERAIVKAAPLAEGEKVLNTWLEKVGGIVYFDLTPGYGWAVQSNRPKSAGATIPAAPKYFSTYSQMLEFALNYAKDTIAGETWGRAAETIALKLAVEYERLGVADEVTVKALAAVGVSLEQEAAEVESKVQTAIQALESNPTDAR